ncbi:hypothetical protein DFJ58DRAFT_804170 [Suillus subalutaceus]|uniref:uncharacterized protein n=1 Tax=Suillus subalutaceus TaxID=48586 RepID=UPI001B88462D|nr:uncharacterized protein DFJ58DRAFT_804170 [Suillus subalutaceus]KAG1843571.1 hypothetical protein DFJ58DRAFT_804170 [Suillus subalutaceus]
MFMDPSARVPHVFVIPPEEEHSQNPPWCCFDADLPPENSRSIEVSSANQPDILFDPSASPVVVPQSRSSTSSSRSEKHQHPHHIIISSMHNNDLIRIAQHDVRDDSDVIEVVKLKRPKDNKSNHTDHVPPSLSNQQPQLKRSKTFRARASRAFQSIKNVSLPRGKQNDSKPHVKDLWTSTESMPGIFRGVLHSREDVSPTASRKLSSLFQKQPFGSSPEGILSSSTTTSLPYLKGSDTTPSIDEIRPSYEFIERPLTPCAPTYDHSLRRPVSSADFQRARSSGFKSSKDLKRPVSSRDIQRPEKDLRPVSSDDFQQDERPTSPSPPSTQRSRKRFSVNELHRLFSFSPEPPSSSTVPSTSTSASTSSTHSYPDVPYAAVHFVDDDYGREIEGKYGCSLDLLHGDDELPSPSRPRDISFELRLDSLHFDSLSFNAEDFDVSMNLGTSGLGIPQR